MSKENNEMDLFEKLEGYLPHSDIHYVNIATSLIATVIDVYDAFQERNTDSDCSKFIISVVSALSCLLVGITKASTVEVSNATAAYLKVLQDIEEESTGEEN